MKFLAFQHVPWETPGLIRTAAEAAGHTMEILHPADGPAPSPCTMRARRWS